MREVALVTNAELRNLLSQFRTHLTCWKVDLGHGSFLMFEFGRHWEMKLHRGDVVDRGSVSLVLESYDWKIEKDGQHVADAEEISDDLIDDVASIFDGVRLLEMTFHPEKKQLLIQFSSGLRIASTAQTNDKDGYNDIDLCSLTFPNGRILGCDPIKGFTDDGSQSYAHKTAFQKES